MLSFPMDEARARIIDEEERLLRRVQEAVAQRQRLAARARGAVDYDAELIDLRDQIAEARLEDVAALVAQMERLQRVAERRAEVSVDHVDPGSPYFGHLRLSEQDRTRDVMIGRSTYVDSSTGIRIVDWRDAPVSRLYYRYDEGDDYEETFGGRPIEGEVLARRSLAILDGALRRIGAPQGTFVRTDDGTWTVSADSPARLAGGQGTATRPGAASRGRLGVGSDGARRIDKHLPEIAALIDPRQFDLITQPSSGLVVIHGGAGSGKTTIALHRIAYLAFQEPSRFRPDRILVVVPHPALASYTSQVLPSLGLNGVLVTTFDAWALRQRMTEVRGLPREHCEETPSSVARLKRHPALIEHLARRARSFAERIEAGLQREMHDLPMGDRVRAAWKALRGLDLDAKVAGMAAWLAGKTELGGAGSASALDGATHHVATRTVALLRRHVRDVVGEWAEALTDREALREAFDREDPGGVSDADLDGLVRWGTARAQLFDPDAPAEAPRPSPGREAEEDPEPRDEPGDDDDPHLGVDGVRDEDEERPLLDREDEALLLRIVQLRRGLKRGSQPLRYEHVAVDEAQDLSPVELAVLLGTASGRQSVTLAGDVGQRLYLDNGFSDFPQVLRQLGLDHVAIEPLRIAYRSTREVLALALHVLGPLAGPEPPSAPRGGAPVELHRHSDTGAAVAFLAEALRELAQAEPRASVGVIARYPEQALQFYRGLAGSEVPNLRLVAANDFSFKPGVDVTDVRQVKGLEFDYVILVEVNEATYGTDDESRYLLHIGATRAAHQLWILSSDRPSLLLPQSLRKRGW
ncbi:MAG: ATP-binding domain-containing protein [Deltaproteobacteria bacterium]|nr:ATP-binding domain-containing protein [Deltaproteobacteria bacterium]